MEIVLKLFCVDYLKNSGLKQPCLDADKGQSLQPFVEISHFSLNNLMKNYVSIQLLTLQYKP